MSNYPDSLLKVTDDWRYSNPKMELREQSLTILLKRFGSELNENGEPKKNGVKLSKQAYYNTYRPKKKKELEELLELKGGKEAIKNYMYNDDRLIEAFISNQVGIPLTLGDGDDATANPEWEAFKGGKPLFESKYKSMDVPTTYDEFVNSNKFFANFEDTFVETILNRLDEQFKAANEGEAVGSDKGLFEVSKEEEKEGE